MQHNASQADVAGSDEQQPVLRSLAGFDEIVLIQILRRLPDPLPLAQTCKTLHRALLSGLCRLEWFSTWFCQRDITRGRDPVYAAITWRATQQCNPQQLAQLVIHALQHSPQHLEDATVLQDVSSHMKSGRWIELLSLLSPWPQHLLFMAAASSNTSLLALLLGHHRDQQLVDGVTATDYEMMVPKFTSAMQLQAPEEPSQHHQQQQQQQEQQQQQQMWHRLDLLQPLPVALRLPTYRHDILQSAMVCAARTGQLSCLQALLQQLAASSNMHKAAKSDLLLAVAEVAVAAGYLNCLEAVFSFAMLSSIAGSSNGSNDGGCCLSSSAVGLLAGVQQINSGDASKQQKEQQQQQQQFQPQQQQQPQSRVQQFASVEAFITRSTYLLVAAATSGSATVLAEVLSLLGDLSVERQLPAALVAAGRRGHLQVLRLLLQHPTVSSMPLQTAASDAACHGWPASCLQALLDHMASAYRVSLLSLLSEPLLLALLADRQAAITAMFEVLQDQAVTEQPELLQDVLLLLAHQGQADRVSWVLSVAPTVLVQLGQRAAAAALEGGYEAVAQLIMDAGGERPVAYKAAVERGQLVAAVRAGDVAKVQQLLKEVSLETSWTCEIDEQWQNCRPSIRAMMRWQLWPAILTLPTISVSSSSLVLSHLLGITPASALVRPFQNCSKHTCQLALLKSAASAAPAGSVESVSCKLLQLLLTAVPLRDSTYCDLLALARFCVETSRMAELQLVLSCAGRLSDRAQSRLLLDVIPHVQLPADNWPGVWQQQRGPGASGDAGQGSRNSSTTNSPPDQCRNVEDCGPPQAAATTAATAAATAPASDPTTAAVATAMHLLNCPGSQDLLSCYLTHPWLSIKEATWYMGAAVQPQVLGAFLNCRKGLTQLLQAATAQEVCPPGAKVKQVPLYKHAVRAVLQACDLDLLGAFLGLMEKHGAEMLSGLPASITDLDQPL